MTRLAIAGAAKKAAVVLVAAFVLGSVPARCQTVPASPTADGVAPAIAGVIAAGTPVHVLRTWDQAEGGEGPIPAPDGSVLFPQQEANRIVRIEKDGTFSTYIEHTNRTTGLGFDPSGRLIGTGAQPPQVLVLKPTRSVLAETFEGRAFLRPKHLVVDSKGGVYFTDLTPIANQDRGPNKPPKERELPHGSGPAVYYIAPDGRVVRSTTAVPEPNGIMLSPDEKTLYVTNLPGAFVVAFDVLGAGKLDRARNFGLLPAGEASRADGMAVDASGRLYVAAVGGVEVFAPDGRHLGTIPFVQKPGNLAFAGPGKRTLYVVSRGVIYTIAMQAEGFTGRAK